MKKEVFYRVLRNETGNKKSIKEYSDLFLAIDRGYKVFGIETGTNKQITCYISKNPSGYWDVTEETTGMLVSRQCNTKKEAEAELSERLVSLIIKNLDQDFFKQAQTKKQELRQAEAIGVYDINNRMYYAISEKQRIAYGI